jgi:hypothetical protein
MRRIKVMVIAFAVWKRFLGLFKHKKTRIECACTYAVAPKHSAQAGIFKFKKLTFTRWFSSTTLSLSITLVLGCITSLVEQVAAQVPQPGVTISLISTNQVQIDITNAVSTANYELYRTPVLGDPAFPWNERLTIGSLGQSNFTATIGIEQVGFFKVAVGSDWDEDGIPNYIDAQPSNPAVGALVITIDSPANGSTVD